MSKPVTARSRLARRSLAALGALASVVVLAGCGVASVSTPSLGKLNATSSAQNLIAAQSRKPFSGVIYKTGGWLGFSTDKSTNDFAYKSAKGADGDLQRQLLAIQRSGTPDSAALAKAVQAAGTADGNANYGKIAAAITQLSARSSAG